MSGVNAAGPCPHASGRTRHDVQGVVRVLARLGAE
jgi:hypothetical protein